MCTQALAVNGAKVYIVGLSKEKLEQAIETHGQNIPGEIIPIEADVSSKPDIAKLVSQISEKEQCLHILINNAGIDGEKHQVSAQTAEEMKKNLFDDEKNTFEDWQNTYKVNVGQQFFMTTAFLPLLQKASEEKKGGSGASFAATVINISSISGLIKSSQQHFSYNASKAASVHLTRMLAAEVAHNKLQIRINSIAPGVFPSEMTAGESGGDQKSSVDEDQYRHLPAGRAGADRDMAGAVLFAVCNQYLWGQHVVIDGGYTLDAGM
jgi:NAD(P)-dependent dehydrogenase (short-subunit alcohol dehydrogenase family)